MSNMVVRTNIYALNSHRNMKNVGLQQKAASNKLSSGYRINSAADDAAGLAISETMRAQIRGLDQASRNAQDGQAMILTTEGGLEEIGNILQRTRELLVQASNDTNTQGQRDMIQQEIQQLGLEVLGMQKRVEFNTNQVLNMGVPKDITADQATFSAALTTFKAAGTVWKAANTAYDTSISNADKKLATDLSVAAGLTATAVSAAIASAQATYKASVSAADKVLASAQKVFDASKPAYVSAEQTMRTAILGMNGVTTNNYVAWFQVGANAKQGITFDFEKVRSAIDVAGNLVSHIGSNVVLPGTVNEVGGIGYGEDISDMVTSIQTALDNVNSIRANLGAVQNRMDYTMRSLDISSENLSDSESRVRNADMAKEMMRFTMSNVLQQASVSMLSQANQMPQNLLQLLR